MLACLPSLRLSSCTGDGSICYLAFRVLAAAPNAAPAAADAKAARPLPRRRVAVRVGHLLGHLPAAPLVARVRQELREPACERRHAALGVIAAHERQA